MFLEKTVEVVNKASEITTFQWIIVGLVSCLVLISLCTLLAKAFKGRKRKYR